MNSRIAPFFAMFVVAASALAQVAPDRTVVKVNGQPILGAEYYRRMEFQPGMGIPTSDAKFVQAYPGYLTLRWLIEEELVIQLAKSQEVAPTEKEVEDEFKFRAEQSPDQLKGMVQLGFTEQDMKRKILIDLSQFKVLTRGITITDFEVEKHYKENSLRFTLPKRYSLRIVRVGNEDAKKPVEEALARGEKFEEVAARLSNDISKLDGGRLGDFAEKDMLPAARTVVSATRKGQVTPWIEQGGQFAKFLVEDVLQEELLALDAKLKKGIRESLMTDRGQARNNVLAMMQEFRKKAVLEFGAYPFEKDIKTYFELGG